MNKAGGANAPWVLQLYKKVGKSCLLGQFWWLWRSPCEASQAQKDKLYTLSLMQNIDFHHIHLVCSCKWENHDLWWLCIVCFFKLKFPFSLGIRDPFRRFLFLECLLQCLLTGFFIQTDKVGSCNKILNVRNHRKWKTLIYKIGQYLSMYTYYSRNIKVCVCLKWCGLV